MASHYVIMYTATAGANGPLLGTDEEDIVLMQYLVWDAVCRKVVVSSYRFVCMINLHVVSVVNLCATVRRTQHRCCRPDAAATHSAPRSSHSFPARAQASRPLLPLSYLASIITRFHPPQESRHHASFISLEAYAKVMFVLCIFPQ